nr:MAG: RNA-dependent RNA polymerase [Porcine picobirnavirus]
MYFDLPNPGLRAYFGHVREGQPDEYRTPFAKGKSPQEVCAEWATTLETISDKWPTLLDFENDLRAKVGPMSIMKPLEQRLTDIDSYYESILKDSVPIDTRAIDCVLDEFEPVRGLRQRSLDGTLQKMRKSTNSGSPFFTKRKNVHMEYCQAYFYPADKHCVIISEPNWNASPACAILGWRGQEGGPSKDDVKQRVVWMFPYAVNVRELQIYQPLIEACQKFNLVPAWVSMEEVDRRITAMFDTKGKDDLVICTDFSKFDQHFNEDMADASRSILLDLLTPDSRSKDWIINVFPIKYNIPLAYDYGVIRYGRHGMASGSGGTNADETLAHRALQYEAALHNNAILNPNSQCLGDDGVLTYPGITVEDVIRSYTAHGQEMNESKQYVSTQDCVYLRRWHHTDYRINNVCVGVYSTYRALGRLCEQERFYDEGIWSAKMVALRQLSIIENVKNHPLRDQFAQFCMARDKFRLGLDIPGFLDNIEELAQKSTELMPDFLGYTKSMQKRQDTGINDWWIVKYLKSLK